jgi:hypothetical protein
MASDKKKRLAKKSKYATKTGEFRHTDGDRRHRGFGAAAKQAGRDKRARQTFTGGIPADDPPPTAT